MGTYNTSRKVYFIPLWLAEFMKATREHSPTCEVDYRNVEKNLTQDDLAVLYRANVIFMNHIFPSIKLAVSKNDPRGILESPWAKLSISTLQLNPGECIISPLYEEADIDVTNLLVDNCIANSVVCVDDSHKEGAIIVTVQPFKRNVVPTTRGQYENLYESLLTSLSEVAGLETALKSTLLEEYLTSS